MQGRAKSFLLKQTPNRLVAQPNTSHAPEGCNTQKGAPHSSSLCTLHGDQPGSEFLLGEYSPKVDLQLEHYMLGHSRWTSSPSSPRGSEIQEYATLRSYPKSLYSTRSCILSSQTPYSLMVPNTYNKLTCNHPCLDPIHYRYLVV